MAIQLPFAVEPVLIGAVAGGNELANRPGSHLARLDYMGMVWRSSDAVNLWVRGQFSAVQTIDFVSLINAAAQAGTTIRVRLGNTQAEVDGTAQYDSGALPFINPAITREDGSYHSHLEIAAPVSCTWWRIDIGGHTGAFEAAGLVMGKKLTAARFYDLSFEHGVKDLGSLTISPGGVVTETPGVVLRTLLFQMSWVSEAEHFEMFGPLAERIGQRGLTYWCFDPEPTVYRQAKSYLGYFTKDIYARGRPKPRTFSQEYSILSLI